MHTWSGRLRPIIAATALAAVVGCGAGGTTTAPEPAGATSFPEYAAAACEALQALWRAYGNPETATMSDLMRSFDAAMQAGDVPAATARAAEVKAELERGRKAAGVASAWTPGLQGAVALDRLLAAMEALVDARVATMPQGYAQATNRGQAAFMAAGGVEAWRGMLAGLDAASKAGGMPFPKCEGVPIGG